MTEALARCTKLLVLSAAKRLKSLSSQTEAGQFTAKIAIRNAKHKTTDLAAVILEP